MTLTVSTDLSVNTGLSRVEEKLKDKQTDLRDSIEKGEPKIFGVSQIVIGLLIISYSVPLLSAPETTLILNFGVPWWSGLMCVISGTAAIAVEKNGTLKTVSVCLAVSVVAVIISAIALILYYVDIASNPTTKCNSEPDKLCDQQHYATRFGTGVKISISVVNTVQTALSSAFTAIMYNKRRDIRGYTTMSTSERHPA